MCISWNNHFLQVLTSASLFKVRESCFVIQKFDVTDSGNYPGWTSFSDYKMTTKFISQPSSAFKMNYITHIWLLWAWRHTCTLSGLPLSRQYEIPLLFQTKIRLYREAETKIFKIRIFNFAENEFQTTKSPDFFLTFGILSQIPWLFKVFQVSHNPALLSLLPMSENLAWIMWMDWNKYLIIGAVICYEYLNIWLIKNLLLATLKNWF